MQVLYGASSAWTDANAWTDEDTAASAPAAGVKQRSELQALAGQVLEGILQDRLWNAPTHLLPGQQPNDANARCLTPQVLPLTSRLRLASICAHARRHLVSATVCDSNDQPAYLYKQQESLHPASATPVCARVLPSAY